MAGNCSINSLNSFFPSSLPALISQITLAAPGVPDAQSSSVVSTNLFRAKSGRMKFCAKKSAPKIGLVTSATMNSCTNDLFPSLRLTFLLPYVLMPVPLAAANGVCAGLRRSSGEAGKTDMSAPVSAKYGLSARSQIVKVRPVSFPLTEAIDKGRYGRNDVDDVGEDGDGLVVSVDTPA